MQISRDEIERSLPQKGFVREDSSHRYFYHEFEGKRTGAYTYTSHGSEFRIYGAPLIGRIKPELRLDSNRQVVDLCQCPMSAEDYNEILKAKSLIKAT